MQNLFRSQIIKKTIMERRAQGIISILGFEPKLKSRLVVFDALAAGL